MYIIERVPNFTNMKIYDVEVEGTAPLLMHRFADDFESEKPTKRTTQPTVQEQLEAALYRFPDGKLYQPGRHIEGAMIKASVDFRKAGRGKKSLRSYFLASVFVRPDAIPHSLQKVELDRQRVVVRATKGAVMRVRGRLDKWKLCFQIENRSEDLDAATIQAVLQKAGEEYGIGDYRPRYGTFRVTRFQEVETGV